MRVRFCCLQPVGWGLQVCGVLVVHLVSGGVGFFCVRYFMCFFGMIWLHCCMVFWIRVWSLLVGLSGRVWKLSVRKVCTFLAYSCLCITVALLLSPTHHLQKLKQLPSYRTRSATLPLSEPLPTITTGHYAIRCKNLSLALLKIGKRLPETC